MFGISQSADSPRIIVSAMPKPAASSVRHGSRPTKPGTAYSAQTSSRPQRGSLPACNSVTMNGLIGRKKGSRSCLPGSFADRRPAIAPLLAAGELLAELLDAARFDDALLRTSIERMRLGRDVELEQRVFLAVVHRDLLARA